MAAHERLKFWICTAFLLGAGGWLGFVSGSHLVLTRLLDREGVTTLAKVVDHSSESYSRRSSNLKLTVVFTPANHPPVIKTLAVSGHIYSPAVKQGEVEIRYLPDRPERCQAEKMSPGPFYILLGLGSVMALAGVLLLGFHGRAALKPSR